MRTRRAALWLAAGALLALAQPAAAQSTRAESPEFSDIQVVRSDDGVLLSFALRYELPRGVEEALLKGVPLYFVVEAELYRDRWYWRDRRLGQATRVWRIAYQPLTRKFRVTLGNDHQIYDGLNEALMQVHRVSGWKIAEAGAMEDGAHHYVELRYRLDTTLLPRQMQLGIGGQPEWTLVVEKLHRID